MFSSSKKRKKFIIYRKKECFFNTFQNPASFVPDCFHKKGLDRLRRISRLLHKAILIYSVFVSNLGENDLALSERQVKSKLAQHYAYLYCSFSEKYFFLIALITNYIIF